jgi:DNA-binding CsgD family transcriptional regulator
MKKASISTDEVRFDIGNLEFDEFLPDYKSELLSEIDPDKIMVLKNQFFFITDCQNFNNIFVHNNIKSILGYEPEFFKSLNNIYSCVHPDDHDFVLAFSRKTILYSRELSYKPALIKNPKNFTFSIDFLMRRSDGLYLRLNRLSSSLILDRKGNLVYSISVFTDINHINNKKYVSCSWTEDEPGLFNIDDIRKKYLGGEFTPREIQIIQMLSRGLEGREIAGMLNISEHTVISHRKTILRKARVNNTPELVRYAIENGII